MFPEYHPVGSHYQDVFHRSPVSHLARFLWNILECLTARRGHLSQPLNCDLCCLANQSPFLGLSSKLMPGSSLDNTANVFIGWSIICSPWLARAHHRDSESGKM